MGVTKSSCDLIGSKGILKGEKLREEARESGVDEGMSCT